MIKQPTNRNLAKPLPEILIITSYPPQECGIATYSQDLIKALNNKFSSSLAIKVCALDSGENNYIYPEEVTLTLNTSIASDYEKLVFKINADPYIKFVLIQHEFGFYHSHQAEFEHFLLTLIKPIIIVFHTVLPHPDNNLKEKVQRIVSASNSVVVMTNTSSEILVNDYNLPRERITVIPHGTHLVTHLSQTILKEKYGLEDRKVITTFGLLSSGKSIETTIEALPAIVQQSPDVVFLIMGKTHPEVIKREGEKYREMLIEKVKELSMENHVRFINKYLALPELLEYLQLTDIYIFTTNDPNQAVSGTFAYAMSCSCPIISTPIPHAREILTEDTGIIFNFKGSEQLSKAVILLLNDEEMRHNMSTNTLQKIVATAWENSAIDHAFLFEKLGRNQFELKYNLPEINLEHLKLMTTDVGIIQFSKINQPDIESGYTLDDNARALIALSTYYKSTGDKESLPLIQRYLNFIQLCQRPNGDFVNYIDKNLQISKQNNEVNLDDSNGRAIWALGHLISIIGIMPSETISQAVKIIKKAIFHIENIHSTRAIAFAIKGLSLYNTTINTPENSVLIRSLANRIVEMYKHESKNGWEWYEAYLTYANSVIPEAILYAWLLTGESVYKNTAIASLKFLISNTFKKNGIEVISNKGPFQKGMQPELYGEQPIDVAYTIMTLSKFYEALHDEEYLKKMIIAFNWFLGNNRLHQIVYNPCTGGCYDGLEELNVNLNQGAESTISYLLARLTIEKYARIEIPIKKAVRVKVSLPLLRRLTPALDLFENQYDNYTYISLPDFS